MTAAAIPKAQFDAKPLLLLAGVAAAGLCRSSARRPPG